MKENKFNEFLVEGVLLEIKNYVFSQIISQDKNCLNVDLRAEKTDAVMKEILADMLKNKEGKDSGEFKYNYQAILGCNGETGERLRMHLILYYTALYFDNHELLIRILSSGFSFGHLPSPLCILDNRLADLFDEEEYLQMLQEGGANNMKNFYNSVKDDEESVRNEHLQKFSSFYKARWQTMSKKIRLNPDVLKVLPLEILLKISPEMFHLLFHYGHDVLKIEDKERFFALLGCSNLNLKVLNAVLVADYFDFLTNEQILAFGEYSEFFGLLQNLFRGDKKRLLNLCCNNINICKYSITSSDTFLNMFTDEEIISMNDGQLSFIQTKFLQSEEKNKGLRKSGIVRMMAKINN